MNPGHLLNVFPDLKDKRMSELSALQKADALEQWIRVNWAFALEPDHISFLLRRIDALRGAIGKHTDEISYHLSPETSRELLDLI